MLYTVFPATGGTGPSGTRVKLPNNLVAFIALLLHLQCVGYPSHWLAEFLQPVLDDNLVTDVKLFDGQWPIPLSDFYRRAPRRRVRLDVLRAEMETILAFVGYGGMSIFVQRPQDFAAMPEEIGIFEAKVSWLTNSMGVLQDPSPSGEENAVHLLLYRPTHGLSPETVVTNLYSILDRQDSPPAGSLFVLTALELLDFPETKVQWRMSRVRVEKMREQEWVLVVYRSDARVPGA
jgi:hypothetical protein